MVRQAAVSRNLAVAPPRSLAIGLWRANSPRSRSRLPEAGLCSIIADPGARGCLPKYRPRFTENYQERNSGSSSEPWKSTTLCWYCWPEEWTSMRVARPDRGSLASSGRAPRGPRPSVSSGTPPPGSTSPRPCAISTWGSTRLCRTPYQVCAAVSVNRGLHQGL